MAVKRRRIKTRKLAKPEPSVDELLAEMRALLLAGHGTEEDARAYFTQQYRHRLNGLQSIITKAVETRSWKHMDGCYMQAAELFVLASVLYEKHPEHVIMSDAAYDHLSRWILKNFKKLPKDFRSWYNITSIDLKAGTGHAVVQQEPVRWMVFLITGHDEPAPSSTKKPKVRRKRRVKRT
jgi:hypothetical protein